MTDIFYVGILRLIPRGILGFFSRGCILTIGLPCCVGTGTGLLFWIALFVDIVRRFAYVNLSTLGNGTASLLLREVLKSC
jgi:hypothetical protein